jgi:uncharacterized delta-60 repeat protein
MKIPATKQITQKTLIFALTLLVVGLAGATNLMAQNNLDPTFGNGGKVITDFAAAEGAGAVVLQPDGKLIVAGTTIVRYNGNGSLDTSFGNGGRVSTGFFAFAVVLQPDGKIVAAGPSVLARYNADGSLDSTFGNGGKVTVPGGTAFALVLQADGKLVTAGSVNGGSDFALIRYNTNGSLDSTFGNNGRVTTDFNGRFDEAYALVLQADGKLVAAGTNYSDFALARYNSNGTLDMTFGTGGIITTDFGGSDGARDVVIQPDGKIVAAGGSRSDDFEDDSGVFALARYNADGTLDATFGSGGKVTTDVGQPSYAPGLALQADGKIVAAGSSVQLFIRDFALVRYNTNGTLDTTFGAGGIITTDFGGSDGARDVVIQPDGKIVAAGYTANANFSASDFALARYLGDSVVARRTPFDFDGDGKADVSVFRPSDRTWYLNQSTNGLSATQFGLSTDKITPADYDGDGRTDIAVWRETTPTHAYFYILESKTNTFRFEQFGTTGDIPVSADFDGDGKADVAVYRNGASAGAQSFFFYRPSGTPGVDFRTIYWGAAGNKPVVGDYDGDGKADAAVFDPATGIWYVLRSLDNQLYAIQFGSSTDKLVPADYDGDGKTDVAVFRPDDGTWYLNRSRDGFTGAQFGFGTDKPVPADYDGDGRTDIAVFRDGTWYLNRSRDGFTGVTFGNPTDKPVPNAFVP